MKLPSIHTITNEASSWTDAVAKATDIIYAVAFEENNPTRNLVVGTTILKNELKSNEYQRYIAGAPISGLSVGVQFAAKTSECTTAFQVNGTDITHTVKYYYN